jgi:hypothetical protein
LIAIQIPKHSLAVNTAQSFGIDFTFQKLILSQCHWSTFNINGWQILEASLIFENKALTAGCSTWVISDFTRRCYTSLKNLSYDKHSSLFRSQRDKEKRRKTLGLAP